MKSAHTHKTMVSNDACSECHAIVVSFADMTVQKLAKLVEEDQKGLEMIDHQVTARWCSADSAINQILGYENKKVVTYAWQNKQGAKGKGEVTKRYRY